MTFTRPSTVVIRPTPAGGWQAHCTDDTCAAESLPYPNHSDAVTWRDQHTHKEAS